MVIVALMLSTVDVISFCCLSVTFVYYCYCLCDNCYCCCFCCYWYVSPFARLSVLLSFLLLVFVAVDTMVIILLCFVSCREVSPFIR